MSNTEQLLLKILELVLRLLNQCHPPKFRFQYAVGPTVLKERQPNRVNIQIDSTQKELIHLNPVDTQGDPEPVDGVPAWTVQDGDVTLDVQPDGLSAWIISGAAGIVSHVGISADADPGPGMQTIIDTIEVTVTHPFASNLGLTADAPVPKISVPVDGNQKASRIGGTDRP